MRFEPRSFDLMIGILAAYGWNLDEDLEIAVTKSDGYRVGV